MIVASGGMNRIKNERINSSQRNKIKYASTISTTYSGTSNNENS